MCENSVGKIVARYPYGPVLGHVIGINSNNKVVVKAHPKEKAFVRYNDDFGKLERFNNVKVDNKFMFVIPTTTVAIGDMIIRKNRFLQVIGMVDKQTNSFTRTVIDISSNMRKEIFPEPLFNDVDLYGFKKIVPISMLDSAKPINVEFIAPLLSYSNRLNEKDLTILLTAVNTVYYGYYPKFETGSIASSFISSMMENVEDGELQDPLTSSLIMMLTDKRIGEKWENNGNVPPCHRIENYKKIAMLDNIIGFKSWENSSAPRRK